LFERLLARVDAIETAREPERCFTNPTGGFKHFPVRMRVRASG